MPQINAAYVRAFSNQIEALNKSAGKVIVTEEKRLNLTRRIMDGDESAYDELLSLMHTVCGSYNKLSASLTCRFYNGIRQGANLSTDYEAQPYNWYDEERLDSSISKSVDEVMQGRNTVPLVNLMTNIASGELKIASDRTTRNNAIKDPGKPMFCIVANTGACAFCQMRASLGYQYPEKASIESHDHCTCVATPIFKGQKVQDYDPKVFEDRYYAAKNLLNGDDVPEELQKRIERAKEAHSSRSNEPWRASNETLIAMRYLQGISS